MTLACKSLSQWERSMGRGGDKGSERATLMCPFLFSRYPGPNLMHPQFSPHPAINMAAVPLPALPAPSPNLVHHKPFPPRMPQSTKTCLSGVPPAFQLIFSQEDVDMVLYGYARSSSAHVPGHALSGLRIGHLSYGQLYTLLLF